MTKFIVHENPTGKWLTGSTSPTGNPLASVVRVFAKRFRDDTDKEQLDFYNESDLYTVVTED